MSSPLCMEVQQREGPFNSLTSQLKLCGEKWLQNWTQSLVKWWLGPSKKEKMACGKRGEGKLVNAGNSRVPANSAAVVVY